MKKAIAISVVIAALTAVLLYSCRAGGDEGAETSQRPTSTESSTPHEPPTPTPKPDTTSPEYVAQQAMTVAFTWTPGTDARPADGFRRAAQWFTPELSAHLTADVRTDKGPSLQWDRWSETHARIIAEVMVGCSGCPPDSDTSVHRVASISQTAVTGDTSSAVEPDTTVWLTLTNTGGRWLIDTLSY
ncbi:MULTISPECIES: hypothetical protein [Rhodococcus]|jgi:hypothetical protein|uniref:hypothetical protein n=1 Tax=Rhodococcus TaxID=1827 RepID=UPI001DF1847D|nr:MULTISPECIES: hypothetical protein [Rhodococcus]MBP2520978.1 hypothetical protein [Rhodococcus sp. PvP104]